MTDEQKPFQRIEPEEIVAFWKARNSDVGCPYCRTNSWVLFFEAAGQRGNLVALLGDQASLDKLIFSPMLSLSCTNCGNIRMIDKDVFQAWKAKKKDPA